MAAIRWSSQARHDLEALIDYYRSVSAAYAERLEEKIFEATRRLAVFPLSG